MKHYTYFLALCLAILLPSALAAQTSEVEFTVTDPPMYSGHGPSLEPIFNYGKALQMTWYFYEAQRSGFLPRVDGDLPFTDPATGIVLHAGFKASRIPWRGDSDLDDGADVARDLTGGWHDAGDHVKFGLPMAFSASFLAWGVLEFAEGLSETGQLEWAKDNLRWVADYFVRAHPEPNLLYGQVGEGAVDHLIWGAPEVMPHFRPAFKIDMNSPGPDLAAQTAAALTTISLVFKKDEPDYAATLLRHAIELYDFAQASRSPETSTDDSLGRYSDSITDAQSYYASRSGAKDDLPFAAAWLYIATKEPRFLHDAEADYTRIADREGHHGWTAVWDDVRYGVYILMAKIYADADYVNDSLITPFDRHDGYFDYNLHAQNFLNFWLRDGGVARTPGGMAYLSPWGSARYNTMTAFLALVYRNHLIDQNMGPLLQENYRKYATEQINYALGDNPLSMSYVVGFGDLWSQVAHHRAAHGSTSNSIYNPAIPRHILFGALSGGPAANDSYTDDRANFAMTEVAIDMNAGITGALAGLVQVYGLTGNEVDPDFPPPASPVDEMFVRAVLKTNQPTTLATQLEVVVVNESAYPPRGSDGLLFRYFVDLSEVFERGYSLDDVILETYQDEGAGVSLQRWKDSASIFCVEGSFVGTNIVPIGTVEKKKTIQFIIRLPWSESGWDPANDPSYGELVGNSEVVTRKIALYDVNRSEGSQLVWGEEPDPGILQSELPPANCEDPADFVAGFQVATNVYDSWASGYCVEFTLTNSADSAQQPSGFQFVLPHDVTITTSWNGVVSRNGDSVDVLLPSWIGLVEPGQSRTDFGYCASGSTEPMIAEPGSHLLLLAVNFGREDCPAGCTSDFCADGDVDGADLAVFAAHF